MPARTRYIVTADNRQANLYRCESDRDGRCTLEPLRELRNTAEPQEHHRPTFLGSGPVASAKHLASPGHQREEQERRFARSIAHWLSAASHDIPEAGLTLFAPPVLLGHLRQETSVPRSCTLARGEFAHLRPTELAQHPDIVACMHAPGSAR